MPELVAQDAKKGEVYVCRDYIAIEKGHLGVYAGDYVEVVDDTSNGNLILVRDPVSGDHGLIPADVCETAQEKEARINTWRNMNIKSTSDDPPGTPITDKKKSVSFETDPPTIIPCTPTKAEENMEEALDAANTAKLAEEFEQSLNLTGILEKALTEGKRFGSGKEELIKLYRGGVPSLTPLDYTTVAVDDTMLLRELEDKVLAKFGSPYGEIVLVHNDSGRQLRLPSKDFTLSQVAQIARKVTVILERESFLPPPQLAKRISDVIYQTQMHQSMPEVADTTSKYKLVVTAAPESKKVAIQLRTSAGSKRCVVDGTTKVEGLSKRSFQTATLCMKNTRKALVQLSLDTTVEDCLSQLAGDTEKSPIGPIETSWLEFALAD